MTTKAFAYLRTSSGTNVGADKDSDKRQRSTIFGFAKANKFEVAGEYYDADVKGADAIHTRPAFAEMLKAMLGNGVRTILVESASRFARDLITYLLRRALGDLFLGRETVPAPGHFAGFVR